MTDTRSDFLKQVSDKITGFVSELDKIETMAKQKHLPFDREKLIQLVGQDGSIKSAEEAYGKLYQKEIEEQVDEGNLADKIGKSLSAEAGSRPVADEPVPAPTKENLSAKVDEALKDGYDW